MCRKPYGVEPPMTLLQEVKDLKAEIRGKGYVLTTNEDVASVTVMSDLFRGLKVPNGITKVTFRFKYAGIYANLDCELCITSEYRDYYFGHWFDGSTIVVWLDLDDNSGTIQHIASVN